MPDDAINLDPIHVEQLVAAFGAKVKEPLRVNDGQGEANISAAVADLLQGMARLLGLAFTCHREVHDMSLGVRPDFAIDIAGLRVGVVELKAPGVGVPGHGRWGKPHDRKQWQQLSKMPNVLYTDGEQWNVYRYGNAARPPAKLVGDLRSAGAQLRPEDSSFAAVVTRFLCWQPGQPRGLRQMIKISAGLCQLLRDEVQRELRRESREETARFFSEHQEDWREWLFPDLTEVDFVDAYAQTVTFGLLLARHEGIHFEGLDISAIGERLAKRHLLVGRALSILTMNPRRGVGIEERSTVLQVMRRVIGAANWSNWNQKKTYHWLFEEFLDTYDATRRRRSGAYYTPVPVADFMTAFVHQVLQEELRVPRGLADDNVIVLDPAMGTGTFLQSVIDKVAETIAAERGDIPASLRALLTRLIGFERQVGPYAVAELKLDQAMKAHSAQANDEDLQLYVADTLDDPHKSPLPARAHLYKPLADSRRKANEVKTTVAVTVVLGNPPYLMKSKPLGKWILARGPDGKSLLDDFRLPGQGRYEHKLHDLSIYFWRWAIWKAFEAESRGSVGIVAFVSTHGYLDGPGFSGMRRHIRQQAERGWIIDLSADGQRSPIRDRIFPGVQQPICIGVFVRGPGTSLSKQAEVKYVTITGDQKTKLRSLAKIGVQSPQWQDCHSSDWTAPFKPKQSGDWEVYPSIEDLFPYSSLGVTTNRTWVHSPSTQVLEERWRKLVAAPDSDKPGLLKETRDRHIDKTLQATSGWPRQGALRHETEKTPAIRRYGFRSFDQQYLIFDRRVIDFIRGDLWIIDGPTQIYLVTQLREPLKNGPAAVFSANVPDVHHFSGRGGRVIPLFTDSGGTRCNVSPGLLSLLEQRLGKQVEGPEVMAYVAGILSHRGYTKHFAEQTRQPGVRVPLTADGDLWTEAVQLGVRTIWLHTYSARTAVNPDTPLDRSSLHRPAVIGSIGPGPDSIPDKLSYDPAKKSLRFGAAQLSPVSPEAALYEVSGMKIIKHWFDYRKRQPGGRRGASALDILVTKEWSAQTTEAFRDIVASIEGCVALEAKQLDLLTRILAGPLISTEDLENAEVIPLPAETRRIADSSTPEHLF